jgi:hypothetical protein
MPINVLTDYDFRARPAAEAAAHFGKKVPLASEVFEKLSAPNRARAFRLAGVHNARVVQRVRDLVKRGIREGWSVREVRLLTERLLAGEGIPELSANYVRLMFQQNALTAYAVERTQTLSDPDIVEEFPFWQYLTVGNGTPGVNGVRATHAALHGKVFKWNDAFWNHFHPPWEWGCRCFVRPMTASQVAREQLEVINYGFVRTQLEVPGESRKGIKPNPGFDFPRDLSLDEVSLKGLDVELREAIGE